jgi:hypothetical protein
MSSSNTFEDKYTSNESKSTIRNQSIDNTDLIKNLGRSVKKTSRCFFSYHHFIWDKDNSSKIQSKISKSLQTSH